ncbi:hypothetical protein AB4J90_04675 [Geobacillus thermodenitrificans]|jgi:hypothetical protein|uniref:UPF0738 protein GTNG_0708 n=1 Tax=Geobacillus thermodenitrificans (strain NG80-2) TaxID=420246 RepID=Y708_GEOTN|nr:hypothetical protein [Geobacillus thermodenitrificans]A4IL84.1 RecName: Full=UPF0738 protein GTNG_0708 [Geobacillus thermodenitrificans NG80-2]ABO66088.1 Conserved hypothetical protein [Geobacillus thermodenitrificans NG80-2]ARP41819.1 hypothetical protein GTHT12_00254 [Geobacillus thermodenitrificans]MEC5189011.1 hypothetical protein [Geobacillus thermodenitrificans]MED3717579.1 hypothetical protein [Geobacillus thermodenitrificans]MED3906417.1 hypothetical protein [Geobacillus thermodeni
MSNKVTVERAERKDGRLWLYADNVPVPLVHVTPKRHMLVDSDALAFVYILETDDRFLYVIIPKQWWPELKAAFAEGEPIWLESEGMALELEQFGEELAYLLENIRDNANYGETFEQAVQEVFFAE